MTLDNIIAGVITASTFVSVASVLFIMALNEWKDHKNKNDN
jgi:hypothetical protein